MQTPPQYLPYFPESEYYRHIRVRSMIDSCEASLVYILKWSKDHGYMVTIQALEMQRRDNPPADNIFAILKPYIRLCVPTKSKRGLESLKEFDVEY
jgi:hypothetical protein